MDPTPIRRRQKGSACVQKCADKKKLPALIHVSEPDHGISGAGLKRIAMICMLLDHTGAILIGPLIQQKGLLHGWTILYWMLRAVGRISFPVYCFLLAEGFSNTRNVQKYLLRLLSWGLISEVPFDLAFSGQACDWHSQNVLFTLYLGLSALAILRNPSFESEKGCWPFPLVMKVPCIAILVGAAEIAHCDYGAKGVILIISMFHFREKVRLRNTVSGILLLLTSPLEVTAFASFPLLQRYNSTRGNQSKFGMYLFYPAHLMLLCLARHLILY